VIVEYRADVDQTAPDGTVAAETVVQLFPYDVCDFDAAAISEPCIWRPTTSGIWKVPVTPSATRPVNVLVTVRDHVPGNWCVLPDGSGGALRDRWRPNEPPVEILVYFPGDGVCISGGAGGDFFPIGNPESFYLVADGAVTVTPCGGDPVTRPAED
jgi:hypothetical protein